MAELRRTSDTPQNNPRITREDIHDLRIRLLGTTKYTAETRQEVETPKEEPDISIDKNTTYAQLQSIEESLKTTKINPSLSKAEALELITRLTTLSEEANRLDTKERDEYKDGYLLNIGNLCDQLVIKALRTLKEFDPEIVQAVLSRPISVKSVEYILESNKSKSLSAEDTIKAMMYLMSTSDAWRGIEKINAMLNTNATLKAEVNVALFNREMTPQQLVDLKTSFSFFEVGKHKNWPKDINPPD